MNSPVPSRYRVVEISGAAVGVAMNDAGQIVGRIVDPSHGTRAVLLEAATLRDLGTLGGSFSAARGINAAGVIVGASLTAGDAAHHGFLCWCGELRDLNAAIDSASGWEVLDAWAINSRGEILAQASTNGCDHTVLLVPVSSPTEHSTALTQGEIP